MRWTRPADAGELAEQLAGRAGTRPLLATGAEEFTPPGAGGPEMDVDVVSTAALDRVLDHRPDDLTIRAGAGIRLRALSAYLEERGQWIPIFPHDSDRSLGGWLAAGDVDQADHAYGPVRRQLLACVMIGFDGVPRPFGRPRLACGSRGRLGVISEATLRVWPLPAERRRYAISADRRELLLGSEMARGAGRGPGRTLLPETVFPFLPELLSWEESPVSKTQRLLVGLDGSTASVSAREEQLASWVDMQGATLHAQGAFESPTEPEPGGTGKRRSVSLRQRRVRLTVPYRHLAAAAQAAGRVLSRSDVRDVQLDGYPCSAVLVCSYRVQDLEAAGPVLEALRSDCGATSVCVERGGAAEHAAAEARRPASARELERRVLAALVGRTREWLADYV
jgi:FAD/FMN-containing dehydrogenase